MKSTEAFTEGRILSSLLRFAVPVLFSLFLQALYGGVDLLVVGQFASTSDVSGVATGSMLLQTVTMIITGLSMGITILVGEKSGRAGHDGSEHQGKDSKQADAGSYSLPGLLELFHSRLLAD